jgi:hypothetical protein
MGSEAERSQIEAALGRVAKEFKGINISQANMQEYAALSEILRAAIFAADRAVENSPLSKAEGKDQIKADMAIEILRLTVRRQEPPQILMMQPQAGGGQIPGFPFGGIPGLQ